MTGCFLKDEGMRLQGDRVIVECGRKKGVAGGGEVDFSDHEDFITHLYFIPNIFILVLSFYTFWSSLFFLSILHLLKI